MANALPSPVSTTPSTLVDAFLARYSSTSRRVYDQALSDFARYVNRATPREAAVFLLGLPAGEANRAVLDYRSALQAAGKSPTTISVRLSALRALARLGRTLGVIDWSIEIPGPRAEPYRDTRGPGEAGVRRLLLALEERSTPAGCRDLAAVRLLVDLALRRSEVVNLDLEHVDPAAGTVRVRAKGRHGRDVLTLPRTTRDALAAWIKVRGAEPGPLFLQLDNARDARSGATPKTRLSSWSLWRALRKLGEELGIRITPHGLRHSSITRALDLTRGDLRAVQRFSRHRDVRTLTRYDDNREDLGGDVARRVSSW